MVILLVFEKVVEVEVQLVVAYIHVMLMIKEAGCLGEGVRDRNPNPSKRPHMRTGPDPPVTLAI